MPAGTVTPGPPDASRSPADWRRADLWSVALIACAVFVALAPTLSLEWTADDGALLNYSARYRIVEYLLDPELLRIGSGASLTPVLHLFYSLNLAVFGVDWQGFRATGFALAALAALCYYGLLRLFARPVLGLVGTIALVASLPYFYVASTFMTSHYVAGLACACGAVIAMARALRLGGWPWALASAFCYGLAAISKEVYLPVIVVLGLMVYRERDAWTRLAPHAAVLCAYFAWRHAVLGSFVGGYRAGLFLDAGEWMPVASTLLELPSLLLGGVAFVAAVGASLALLLASGGTARTLAAGLLIAAGALMPLLPLMPLGLVALPDRYLLAAFASLVACMAYLAERLARRARGAVWVAVPLLGTVLVASASAREAGLPPVARAFSAQSGAYRDVLSRNAPVAVVLPASWPADESYWTEMLSLARSAVAGARGDAPAEPLLAFFGNGHPALAAMAGAGVAVERFDEACNCLRPVSAQQLEARASGEPAALFGAQPVLRLAARPEAMLRGERTALGTGTVRGVRVDEHDPRALLMSGFVDLSSEADRVTVLLPTRDAVTARLSAVEPVPPPVRPNGDGGPKTGARAAFELRLRFAQDGQAQAARDTVCIRVQSIGPAQHALLQGQPDDCRRFLTVDAR